MLLLLDFLQSPPYDRFWIPKECPALSRPSKALLRRRDLDSTPYSGLNCLAALALHHLGNGIMLAFMAFILCNDTKSPWGASSNMRTPLLIFLHLPCDRPKSTDRPRLEQPRQADGKSRHATEEVLVCHRSVRPPWWRSAHDWDTLV